MDEIQSEVTVNETSVSENAVEIKSEENASSGSKPTVESTDEFSYTKRGDFTSELYKIEIRNLPGHIGYDTIKKLFKKVELKPIKTKLIGKLRAPTHSFVSFRSDEERDHAISILNDYHWKGKKLIARKANPSPDPLIKKRNESKSDDMLDSKRVKIDVKQLTEEEASVALNDKVCCYWRLPYAQQKKEKCLFLTNFIEDLNRSLAKIRLESDEEYPLVKNCQLDEIRTSPVLDGYRNKCEFTVGIDKTVGFRMGLYREGTIRVVTPALNCPIIGDKMRKAMNGFQKYIRDVSQLSGFDPETHNGHWIQCTVRTSTNDSMIIIRLHPQQLSAKELAEEKNKIIDFFRNNEEFGVNSAFLHVSHNRKWTNDNLEHLFGKEYLTETIEMDRPLEFRISPLAFFQINTIGAQICFQSIADLINPNSDLTLLDICCGTGTIGLCLASKFKKVIGIELISDAIKDAKFNAESNCISNVKYIEGKAEEKISEALEYCCLDSDIVAVIDPPRAGLNNSIIRVLRSNSRLKRLVYVSCDPNNAIKNMIDLCRPTSKAYKGQPFVPIRAIPVDLFPHTDRCELLILFERKAE